MSIAFAVTYVPGTPLRDRVVARQKALIPHLEVIRDPEKQGIWSTTVRAYERLLVFARPGTSHVLVLQDDMLPCDNFLPLVHAAVTERPEHPVQLFTMRRVIGDALTEGKPWSVTADGVWGGSTVIPVSWVRPFLDWCAMAVPAAYKHDDSRLNAWCALHGHTPFWHTVPPLLQHVGAAESLVGQSNRLRVSEHFRLDLEAVDYSDVDLPTRGAMSQGIRLRETCDNFTEAGRVWLSQRKAK